MHSMLSCYPIRVSCPHVDWANLELVKKKGDLSVCCDLNNDSFLLLTELVVNIIFLTAMVFLRLFILVCFFNH